LDFSLSTNLYSLCWRKIRKKLYLWIFRYCKLHPFQTLKIGSLVSLSTHAFVCVAHFESVGFGSDLLRYKTIQGEWGKK
jgi:hypothetical protein